MGDLTSVSFTCEICTDTLPLSKLFINSECSSTHHFCTDCMANYIKVKVQDDNTSTIKCPNTDCSIDLDLLSCRSVVPPKLFVRWCDLLCESLILEEFVDEQAYCPHCYELVLNECGGVIRETRCPNCKRMFCFRCILPCSGYHSCSRLEKEVIVRDKNDLLFMETVVREGWTRCPACKCYVERKFGCRVIRCRCRTEFCYDCGRKLSVHSGPCTVIYCATLRKRKMTSAERYFVFFLMLLMLFVAITVIYCAIF